MTQDPYDILGVSRDADADDDQEGLPQASPASCTPTSTRTRRRRSGSRTSRAPTRCSPTRRSGRRTTAAATRSAGAAAASARARASRFTDIMDAFFGGGAAGGAPGPRPASARTPRAGRPDPARRRARRGGLRRHHASSRSTPRVVCDGLPRRGRRARHQADHLRDLPRRRARSPQVQRSFLGEIRTLRPCAACRGFGSDHPGPLPRVLGRRPGPLASHPHRQDPRRCRPRHPRPAHRARARSAPAAARPATSTSRSTSTPHPTFTRHGNDLHSTVTLPMTAAALGTTLTLPLLEADLASVADDLGDPHRLRPRRSAPAPSRAASRCSAASACPSLRGGRGDLDRQRRRRHPDPARPPPGGAAARARRHPRRGVSPTARYEAPHKSMFGRLRDAFQG